MSVNIKVEINGKTTPMAMVYLRELNYGDLPSGCAVLPYKLWVKLEEIALLLEPANRELAEDDLKFPESARRIDLELRRLGWPPLATLAVTYPDAMRNFVMDNDYLVLQELFANLDRQTHDDPQARYVINSVVASGIENNQIVLSGDVLVTSKRLAHSAEN